jgi:hypothetical protein
MGLIRKLTSPEKLPAIEYGPVVFVFNIKDIKGAEKAYPWIPVNTGKHGIIDFFESFTARRYFPRHYEVHFISL